MTIYKSQSWNYQCQPLTLETLNVKEIPSLKLSMSTIDIGNTGCQGLTFMTMKHFCRIEAMHSIKKTNTTTIIHFDPFNTSTNWDFVPFISQHCQQILAKRYNGFHFKNWKISNAWQHPKQISRASLSVIALRGVFYNPLWGRCVVPFVLNLELTYVPLKIKIKYSLNKKQCWLLWRNKNKYTYLVSFN